MNTCEGTNHLFKVETAEGVATPPSRKCLCGRYTWGAMNDKLLETLSKKSAR